MQIALVPGLVLGDEVVVLGERLKGQAKALNQQRSNANITNIVSADQIGRFPDSNIGDALKRIPAISVNYDQGEARFANIRGTEPRLNAITINGERVPSAEAEIRAVQLDLIPADAIQTIEVTKAVTPDMQADAIGGSVNLVTRSAPRERRISATLGSGYNLLREEPQFQGAFVYGRRLNEQFGFVLSGSLYNNKLGSDNAEGEWDRDDNGNLFVGEWDVRRYDITRERRSVSATLDYKINPTSTIFLRGIYNHRDDLENRYRLRFRLDEPNAQGVIEETEIRRQTKGGIGNDEIDNRRLEEQVTYTTSLSGDHLLGKVKLNWLAGISRASEDRPNERYISWRVRDIPVQSDLSDTEAPLFNAVNSSDDALSQYELREITEENQFTKEEDLNFKLDLEIPLTEKGDYKNSVKVGGRFKSKDKVRDNDFFEYEPVGDFPAFAANATDFTIEDFEAGPYRSGFFTDPTYLGSLDLKNSALFEESLLTEEFAAANYEANETVTAGYAMLNQNVGENLFLIAGVRLEQTNVDYSGFEFNDDTEEVSPISGTDDYLNVLPGLHFRYQYRPNTILKGAWTNTIARPDYYDLVPYRAIAVEDEEIELGNPALEPTTSMNFDLMGEHYFESVGIISAGVFFKSIEDFIYVDQSETDEEGFQLIQPRNGASASLLGLEFAGQRQLSFLPGVLKNFNLYLNYTYTSSSADNPEFVEESGVDEEIDLPGTAPHTLNAAINYQSPRVNLGLSFNFTSAYLDPDGLDLTPGLERFYDEVTYLDFNGSVTITPQLRFYVEANNLLNQPLRYYAGDPSRTYQAEYYQAKFSAGLKLDM